MSTEYIERSTAIINRIEGLELVPHAVDRAVVAQVGWAASVRKSEDD